MFSSKNVSMLLAKATMKIIQDDKKVEHQMAECALVIEQFERRLADELGEEIAVHLFAEHGGIRPELESVALDPRVPQQQIEVRETRDSKAAAVTLRQVDILGMVASHERDDKSGDDWIRVTVKVRFALAERSHRDFLARCFGLRLCWTFSAEQQPLELAGRS